jgi:hypothetical protein
MEAPALRAASTRGSSVGSPDRYRLFRPADLLIPAVLVPMLLLLGSGGGGEGGTTKINLPDGSCVSLELDRDTSVTVIGNLGPVIVSVEGGGVRIGSSPCPGQDCVHQRAIAAPGEAVVCIPSGVFVTVEGEPAEGFPDAFSY